MASQEGARATKEGEIGEIIGELKWKYFRQICHSQIGSLGPRLCS